MLASSACRKAFRVQASSGSIESCRITGPTRPILTHEMLEVLRNAVGGRYIVCPLAHVAGVAGGGGGERCLTRPLEPVCLQFIWIFVVRKALSDMQLQCISSIVPDCMPESCVLFGV